MLKRNFLIIFTLLGIFSNLHAQQLLTPSKTFSHKKTAYITLQDGTEIKGTIGDIDRKKGNIKFVKIKDGTGTKHKLKATSIKYMYLPPSGLDKLSKAVGFLHDAKKWNDEKLNQDFLDQGYVYFETVNVKIKKKTRALVMQLLNPTFSKIVKVYYDPYTKETMSAGVGNVKLVGGNAKSYFIMTDNDPAAYKIEKKRYKKEFKPMWKNCEKLSSKTDIKWGDFVKDIIEYTECGN